MPTTKTNKTPTVDATTTRKVPAAASVGAETKLFIEPASATVRPKTSIAENRFACRIEITAPSDAFRAGVVAGSPAVAVASGRR